MILTKTFAQLDEELVYALARSPNTCPSILKELSEDSRWSIRMGVARNPNVSFAILNRLSIDEDWGVRLGVAENPKVTKAVLKKLINDSNETIVFIADCRLREVII